MLTERPSLRMMEAGNVSISREGILLFDCSSKSERDSVGRAESWKAFQSMLMRIDRTRLAYFGTNWKMSR